MSLYAVNGKEPIAAWIESLDPEPTSSTIITDLVGTNHGTMTNMVPTSDRVANTGEGGIRALDFDGVNDNVRISSAVTPANTITVSAWVYLRAYDSFPMIISTVTGSATQGNAGYELRFYSTTGRPEWIVDTNFRQSATSPGVIPLLTWTHLVGTLENGSRKIYVNGVLTRTMVDTVSITYGSSPITSIGARQGTTTYNINGLIDDIRIWNVALDATDVAALYTAQRGGITNPPPSPAMTRSKSVRRSNAKHIAIHQAAL